MDEGRNYIYKIRLELQPRSRRGYRRLFRIRENRSFNEQLFDLNHFTERFLNEYNQCALRQGQHIKCEKLIVAVKQIQRGWGSSLENTHVEYQLKGLPFNSKEGKINQSFVQQTDNKTLQSAIDVQVEKVYSCSCSQCQKSLMDGEFFIKTANWSRPIVCLSCYESFVTDKCVRCSKPITFDHHSLTNDGLTYISFVEQNGFYWHSDCCVCVTCLNSLIGKRFYQDQIFHQLFCLEHIPQQF